MPFFVHTPRLSSYLMGGVPFIHFPLVLPTSAFCATRDVNAPTARPFAQA